MLFFLSVLFFKQFVLTVYWDVAYEKTFAHSHQVLHF